MCADEQALTWSQERQRECPAAATVSSWWGHLSSADLRASAARRIAILISLFITLTRCRSCDGGDND